MRKSLLTVALLSTFGASIPAVAADSAHTLAGNVTVASDYKFRGISQTFGEPALQGGFDYSHSSGLYLGNWNSNVSEYAGYPGGNLEMDLYGGYKTSIGDIGLDFGAIYYYYPGSKLGGTGSTVDNTEIYVGASYKFVSAKLYYAVSDYFGAKGANSEDTDGTTYLDVAGAYDLGGGWGINAHVGLLSFEKLPAGDYVDYKVGVTKDVSGYVFGLSYIDVDYDDKTNGKTLYTFTNNSTGEQKESGKGKLLFSMTKSF